MLLPNPQSPSQNPRHLRPKNPRRRPAPPSSRGASSEHYSLHVAEPASQHCRLLALLAGDPVSLRHRRASCAAPFPWSHCSAPPPVEPTSAVVFSWSQWSALPPNISSMAISSLPVTAACRLLHTSPIVGILLLRLPLLCSLYRYDSY
ncbi:hypothetical protein DAI22_05g273400 [Oryza sativa Japonica Group]|nr:hypothetical protein DAI22_05g273400 [Oryza sativa Japonica Group]